MDELHASLALLFAELIDGPSPDAAYMLNGGDPGLLRSLDRLSAAAASSASASGGATIAAHVDHVRYGLGLMNRWSDGDPDPWSSADWTASWRRTTVTEEEWAALRAASRRNAALAQGLADGTQDVGSRAERRHRQRRAPCVSPGRHQADRPVDPGTEGNLIVGPPSTRAQTKAEVSGAFAVKVSNPNIQLPTPKGDASY